MTSPLDLTEKRQGLSFIVFDRKTIKLRPRPFRRRIVPWDLFLGRQYVCSGRCVAFRLDLTEKRQGLSFIVFDRKTDMT